MLKLATVCFILCPEIQTKDEMNYLGQYERSFPKAIYLVTLVRICYVFVKKSQEGSIQLVVFNHL